MNLRRKWQCNGMRHCPMRNRAVLVGVILGLVLFLAGPVFGSSEGEHETKGWVKTDTYKVMNFVVLAGALFFLLRKPLSQALGSRIKGIESQLEELEEKKREAEKVLANYNEKFENLSRESENLIAEYVKQGNEARQRILKEAEAAAEKLEEQARKNIENEFEKARLKLKENILEKAMAKAEEIVKNKITEQDQERLVDEYLEKVVA